MIPLEIPGYETVIQHVEVAGRSFELRTLKDLQQYCDASGTAEAAGISSATWPLFGVVWPSSRVLADSVAADLPALKQTNKRILEIGCGIGLASLVLHAGGADVTATDRHPLAGEFLARNLELNGLPPLPFVRCDWNDPLPDLGRFDLIVASDVLYEPDHPGSVAPFVARHGAPRSRVLVVDPARGNLGRFDRALDGHGFSLTSRHRPPRLKIVVSRYARDPDR